jgi:hypothetical protein
MSDFARKLREDPDVIRILEDLKLARGIFANESLNHVNMIIVFTKPGKFFDLK